MKIFEAELTIPAICHADDPLGAARGYVADVLGPGREPIRFVVCTSDEETCFCEVGLIEKRTMGGGRMAAHYRLVWGATDGPSDSPESGRGAQPIAPQGRNPLRPNRSLNRQDNDVDASSPAAVAEPRTPAADPPRSTSAQPAESASGLFDAQAAASLLVDRGFPECDARRLAADHGPEAVRQGVAWADWSQARGEIRSTYRAACVAAIRGGFERPANAGRRAEAERARSEHADALRAARDRWAASDASSRNRLCEAFLGLLEQQQPLLADAVKRDRPRLPLAARMDHMVINAMAKGWNHEH